MEHKEPDLQEKWSQSKIVSKKGKLEFYEWWLLIILITKKK